VAFANIITATPRLRFSPALSPAQIELLYSRPLAPPRRHHRRRSRPRFISASKRILRRSGPRRFRDARANAFMRGHVIRCRSERRDADED